MVKIGDVVYSEKGVRYKVIKIHELKPKPYVQGYPVGRNGGVDDSFVRHLYDRWRLDEPPPSRGRDSGRMLKEGVRR